MPELPEVETVCRTLTPHVVGKTIVSAEALWPRTVAPAEPGTFSSMLRGQRIERVHRRAKLIVFDLSGGAVLSTHLRMTGKLIIVDSPRAVDVGEPASHLRALLTLADRSELRFYDARKFGRMRIHSADEWLALAREYGLEPLDPAFTPSRFHQLIHSRNRQIKPLLLDQAVIAGIGNIYADEALFKARIHPLQPSSTISRRKSHALHAAIVETLECAIRRQGTTIRDYRTGNGETGTNQAALLVYGAPPGSPCPRCGTVLEKLIVGQRGTTICPRCQRLR
jgi:formamidopyrimidine-DNA glycosylase